MRICCLTVVAIFCIFGYKIEAPTLAPALGDTGYLYVQRVIISYDLSTLLKWSDYTILTVSLFDSEGLHHFEPAYDYFSIKPYLVRDPKKAFIAAHFTLSANSNQQLRKVVDLERLRCYIFLTNEENWQMFYSDLEVGIQQFRLDVKD